MEHDNQDYPAAYAPIPKGIIKDEPEEEPNLEDIQEECGEHDSETLMAYLPLPHGVIKQELQWEEDGHDTQSSSEVHVENKGQDGTITDQENIEHQEYSVTNPSIVKGVVKEEPISDGDDGDDGCELVAYPSLPHGGIKEEQEAVDGRDVFISGGQQIGQQEGNENRIKEATGDAPVIEPLAETPVSGYENDAGEPGTNKRKRTGKGSIPCSGRVLRSRSKGRSTHDNAADADGVKQWEAEELAMEKCDTGAKKQQHDERSEHSSLDGVSSTDDEGDVLPNQSLVEHVPRKKKSVRKPSVKVTRSQEKDKLPFECNKCGRAFKVEIYLKKHATSCGVGPKFPCKECGQQFMTKAHLQQHLMKVHNVEKSQLALFGAGPNIRPDFPFKCDKCNSSYKRKGSLARHLKYECELDPSFNCTLCDYRTTRKENLKVHLMNVHSVDRSQLCAFGSTAPTTRPVQPFKCEKCGKTYKRKKTLTRHLKFECGVDPSFSCTQCINCSSIRHSQ